MKNENQNITSSDLYHDIKGNPSQCLNTFSQEKEPVLGFHEPCPMLFPGGCFIDHSYRQPASINEICNEQDSSISMQGKLYFHAEDRMIWGTQIFPDILRFSDSVSVDDFPNYKLIFNHRYIRKDGSSSQFMHEGSLTFVDDRSLPCIKLSVFAEIGDFKTDETMILTIFRFSPDLGYQKIFKKVYGYTSNLLLSMRELEVIRLCHEGLSGKMIAEKLNLSIHTVKNHKRHSMAKTSTHNISELIHFCIKNHWF